MRTFRVWVGLSAALSLLVLPAAANAFSPAAGRWNGSIDGYKESLHFDVAHNGVLKFTVPKLGCTSVTGYQIETFYVPRASIKGRSFDGKFHPSKGVTVEVKGSFTSAKAAKGVVKELQPCNPGDAPWHANLGRFKPPHLKQQVPTCAASGCVASDGMFIKVTGVDRTIKSVDDPNNIYDSSADPALASGGVGVSVLGTDRSSQGPITFAPASAFRLRLGSGALTQADPTLSTVISQNGANYTCNDASAQQQLTRGASYGPTSLCYDAANASDRQHLTLYYMPDGFDVLAKFPIG